MMLRAKSISVYRPGEKDAVFEDSEANPSGARQIYVDVGKPGITGVFVHVLKDGKMDQKPDSIMTFIGCAIVVDTISVIMPDGKNKKK
jgi:hypothetical protein